ncbi:alpha-beta hydrolase superfamily lysophospholipase [Neorhizobium huautlense]|uniref:Alpha-beta hydrolase superfamily lysophospholipase n=1 Tax=Neorhizobium huautlense TaxID=67774 RepID=A0ABT9Q302_9HYPH|nr:alpha/beta hydrolase [Neorhizobium huautlense]MDP9840469.1 alpha-beta hydrolase superfamily lysophospholipase [Neorhizobium huautlense]
MHTGISHQGHLDQEARQVIRPAAEPLVFAGTIGLFEPSRSGAHNIAVLFAGSFGVEDLCSRRFIRTIAEKLADQGVASLRFDYPGTGDALTQTGSEPDFNSWTDSFALAADHLKRLSGCEKIVITAQGVGAPVAAVAAPKIPGLEAMVLLAPVTSGRIHVRELSAFLSISVEKLSLKPDAEAEAIAQVALPLGVAAGLKTIDLLKLEKPPAAKMLVLARQERATDTQLAEHLQRLGADVTTKPFEGYDRLTINPILAEVPRAVVEKVADWIATLAAPSESASRSTTHPSPVSHSGENYRETPLRFGRNNRLFGIACDPAEGPDATKAQVLLLAAGYERQAGWGSYSARLARDLARAGLSTLRFDCSNVADSPAVEGHEGHVIYTDIQVTDVSEAVDFLQSQSPAPIIAAGRCTGAYLAFQSCLRDPRLKGMVGINPEMFLWPENRPIVSALTEQTQTLKHYGSRFFDLKTLKKALRGEINLARKGKAVGSRLKQHAMRPLSKAVGGVSARERAVYAAFADLQRRQVPVKILYSPGDIGLEEHAHFFGRGRNRYPTITTRTVTGASHTFQHAHARAAYLEAICALADTVKQKT